MFFEAFIWGLGVSCGAAFGLILFFVLWYPLSKWAHKGEQVLSALEINKQSIAELKRRNDIGDLHSVLFKRIAETLEETTDSRRA